MMKMEATDSSSSWLENLSSSSPGRRRAIEELIRGRAMAIKLRNLIKKSTTNEVIIPMNQDLVGNILSSFTNSLSILNNGDSSSDEVSQVLEAAHTQLSSPPPPSWEAYLKSEEDSGESSKRSTVKDRRGCYKRRKCSSESWTEHSSALVADGHAWRKYGQKLILNAKFPRNYFRCTHKFDQLCQASKQVQRIEEEPPVYRTTYYGHHTCRNLLAEDSRYQLMLDSTTRVDDGDDDDDKRPMISFGTAQNNIRGNDPNLNPFFRSFPSSKQESKDHHHQHQSSSSSDDYLVPPQLIPPFEQSNDGHITSRMLSSDRHHLGGDVISGVNSSSSPPRTTASAHSHCCLDIGGDFSSVNFDDVLDFEF